MSYTPPAASPGASTVRHTPTASCPPPQQQSLLTHAFYAFLFPFLFFCPKTHRDSPIHQLKALGSVVVEIETEDGTTGVGVSIGGEPACYIVEHHLSRFVEGQDPR